MRVLVTGAAGSVGQCVVQGLQENHSVRGHDRVPTPHVDDHLVSDLNDFTAVERAVEGMDAIVHLGGLPGGDDWDALLQSNFVGTYHVFEAARKHGVKRIAYASRAGVLGPYPKDQTRTTEMVPVQ